MKLPVQVKATDWGVFRQEFRPHRRDLVLASALTSLAALVELAVVYLLAVLGTAALAGPGRSIDLPFADTFSQAQLSMVLVVMVVVRGVLQLAVAAVQQRMLYRYEQKARTELLAAFVDAEWSTQVLMESTEVYNAIFNYLNQARSALQSTTLVAGYLINFVFMLAGSFLVGGMWTFAIIGGTAALALLLRPLLRTSRVAAIDARQAMRQFVGTMVETIDLSRESRLFAVDQRVKERDHAASEAVADANRRMALASARQSVLYTTGVYVVAAVGLAVVIRADLANPAPFVSVVLLLYRGMGYGQSLQGSYQTLISTEPALVWLRQTRSELTDHALPREGLVFAPPLESIGFSSVSFSYGDDVPALYGIDFTLNRGDALGVVGPSGSGKSTLVQLMLRLRLPTEGRILVNDQDISALDPQSWFGHIVLVPQEARLANMTVLENVLWFREGLTREDAVAALRAAHVLQEVLALPEGLDSPVGESGGNLSGGQRQRLCIARALVSRPDVLILDEPTSALDLVSEEAIRETLAELRGQMTLVIVAHRLSTLRICDQVMVLRAGKIEALARREDLEGDSEFYSEALRLSRLV